MSKSKFMTTFVCLFLVLTQGVTAQDLRTSSVNLAKKVSPTNIHIKENFASEFNILAFALGMYYLDTEARFSKDMIKEHLLENNTFCQEELNIAFDIDNMDFNKKGFTRYYPFVLRDKSFIIRIFDVDEKHYLPDFETFYEGTFENSEIGFQIIPGIKEILKSREAKKITLLDPSIFSTHP